jgi:hypothetical protein
VCVCVCACLCARVCVRVYLYVCVREIQKVISLAIVCVHKKYQQF